MQEVCKDVEGKDSICKILLHDVAASSTAVFVLKLECPLNNRTGLYAGSRNYLVQFTRFYVADTQIAVLSGTRGLEGQDSSVGIATNYGLDGPRIDSQWG